MVNIINSLYHKLIIVNRIYLNQKILIDKIFFREKVKINFVYNNSHDFNNKSCHCNSRSWQ